MILGLLDTGALILGEINKEVEVCQILGQSPDGRVSQCMVDGLLALSRVLAQARADGLSDLG